MRHPLLRLGRRKMLVGTVVGLIAAMVAACSTKKEEPAPSSEAVTPAPPDAEDTAPASPEPPKPLAKTSDVPVGSGVIIDEIVVTQPTQGEFKGLSAICTHKGCTVNRIADGTIDCPCHGSRYNLDGSVANGPATRPLATKAISVQGDSIFLG